MRHASTRARRFVTIGLSVGLVAATIGVLHGSDWPEWRGPSRDGTSLETGLPESWSPDGENVAWTLPFGGRSAPVIFGDRLYLQTATPGDISRTQERLVAVDVDSGAVLWERTFSIYLSDVPQYRVGWASPAVDTDTGNVYLLTVGAELAGVAPDGTVLWTRSLPDEYGAISTHGGRTTSPIVEGDLVILNVLMMGWGDLGRPGNRYFAFDKTTGQTVWISAPQTRHYDTNYSTPTVATINGQRLMIVGGTDGEFHALQVNTGQPVWHVEISKRAILNSALYRDGTVYVSHGEENLDTTTMGMVAAVDATGTGALGQTAFKWVTHGFLPTFASPVMDDERLYSVDNGAILAAFDLATGQQVWRRALGTLQKGSPVLADGKLYVGTENGTFYILRPSAAGVEVVDQDALGTPEEPEAIIASPAIADGRVYVTSMAHVYAIGTRRPAAAGAPPPAPVLTASGPVAQVQVFPYEAIVDPGSTQAFTLKAFDANGNLLREVPAGTAGWALDQLPGVVGANGEYRAPASGGGAGFVTATVEGVTGQARVRVIPPLPWNYDFDTAEGASPWWTSNLKVQVVDVEGGKALLRARDETVGRRAKVYMGRPGWSDYTVQADVRGTEQRRQRGDPGLINQRYMMVLFGNSQKLELHPWQAADEMTVRVPFEWDVDTWYRMKLRVEPRDDGTTLVQGKVWRADQPEPSAWTVEKVDPIGHRQGAPGLYGDGIAEMNFDNLRVYPNE